MRTDTLFFQLFQSFHTLLFKLIDRQYCTYNAAGELTQITDPDSTYSYTYDLDGRMLSVSNEGTPNLPTTIMSYSYDNVGNVLSMTDTINGSLG
jgi:YD repeat-containing protein